MATHVGPRMRLVPPLAVLRTFDISYLFVVCSFAVFLPCCVSVEQLVVCRRFHVG